MTPSQLAFAKITVKKETPEDIIDMLIEAGEKIVHLLPEQQANPFQLQFMKTLKEAKIFRDNQKL